MSEIITEEVTRDSGPAGAADLDLIAAARTYLPALVAEVRALRAALQSAGPQGPPDA